MAMSGTCNAYNPLAANIVEKTMSSEVWVCTAERPVKMHLAVSRDGPAQGELRPGDTIVAEKEGGWLVVKGSGLSAPFLDEQGQRNFKNQRTLAMDQAVARQQAAAHDIRKPPSERSLAGRSTEEGSDGDNAQSFRKAASFRWVDGHGTCHRVDGETELRSELWVCVSQHSVPYRSAKDLNAIVFDKAVPHGGKVNVIREDEEWLRVVEVGETLDAAELFGRRSLQMKGRLTEKETGFWLPITQGGQRLFTSEKMALFEASGASEAAGKAGSFEIGRPGSQQSAGRRGSFRWVDEQGACHRIESAAELHSELWVCVSQHSVPYRSSKDIHAIVFDKAVPHGGKVNVVREGDEWLRVIEVEETIDATDFVGRRSLRMGRHLTEKETGLWLPIAQGGQRLFMSEKMALFEASAGKAGGFEIRRPGSQQSTGGGGAEQPGAPAGRRASFRWVDEQGACHRIENDAELRSELWVCVSQHSVPYRSSKDVHAIVFDKAVQHGGKVNVVREDDEWLRAIEVEETVDAADFVGRRSLRMGRHLTEKETGLWLPIAQGGQRLFVSEKLALFEASAAAPAPAPQTGCSIM